MLLSVVVLFFLVKAVELLLAKGAEIEAQNNYGETALHIMTRRRRLNCVIALLSNGAEVDSQSKSGSTPLHDAAAVSTLGVSYHCLLVGDSLIKMIRMFMGNFEKNP